MCVWGGGGTGGRETRRKGGGRCTAGGGKRDSQGGGKREKKGKITQHCAKFRNSKNAKRREPTNTGREPGLKDTGSGRFKPPCPPPPLTLVVPSCRFFFFSMRITARSFDVAYEQARAFGGLGETNGQRARGRGREGSYVVLPLPKPCTARFFRPFEAIFAFWRRENWGERNTDGRSAFKKRKMLQTCGRPHTIRKRLLRRLAAAR